MLIPVAAFARCALAVVVARRRAPVATERTADPRRRAPVATGRIADRDAAGTRHGPPVGRVAS
jgi:hypothetical protein